MEKLKNLNKLVLQQWRSASRVLLQGACNPGGYPPWRNSCRKLHIWESHQDEASGLTEMLRGALSLSGWCPLPCWVCKSCDKTVTGHKWICFSSFLIYEQNLSKTSDWLVSCSNSWCAVATWQLQSPGYVLEWSCVLSHISLVFKGNETTQFQCPLVFSYVHLSSRLSVSPPQQTSRNFSSDGAISKMMYSYGYHDNAPLMTIHSLDRQETPINVPAQW